MSLSSLAIRSSIFHSLTIGASHQVWDVLCCGHRGSFTDALSALDQEAVCSSL